ncbi:MAG: STAS domain-containing protein [Ferruginibacter sp.]
MNVKINTKEKFIVLIPEEAVISANMTDDIQKLGEYAGPAVPHLVINMGNVKTIAPEAAQKFASLQQEFYERNHSFVICEMQEEVEKIFEAEELTELMNITPTESEAGDIVQMEEIERELTGEWDDGKE